MSVECFGNVEVDTRASKMPQEMQEVIFLFLFKIFHFIILMSFLSKFALDCGRWAIKNHSNDKTEVTTQDCDAVKL